MGKWYNTRTKDVVDVPPALDAQYKARDEWEPFKDSGKAKASDTQNKS